MDALINAIVTVLIDAGDTLIELLSVFFN